MMRRRQTIEPPFGTIKAGMGHPLLSDASASKVGTEMSLHGLELQPQTRDADLGHRTADASDAGLRPFSPCKTNATGLPAEPIAEQRSKQY